MDDIRLFCELLTVSIVTAGLVGHFKEIYGPHLAPQGRSLTKLTLYVFLYVHGSLQGI